MEIAGFTKVSFVDYPKCISAVVFTKGCNLNCSYCHNKSIIGREHSSLVMDCNEVFNYLKNRKRFLDGVVVSGGEPTLHEDLPVFMKHLKLLGYKVKLDTNGTNPKMLEKVIYSNLADYVAMDLKAPFEKYKHVCGCDVDSFALQKSIAIIKNSGIDHEFRTTLCGMLTSEDIVSMAGLVDANKTGRYIVQRCRTTDTYSKDLCVSQERWITSYLPKLTGNVLLEARGF